MVRKYDDRARVMAIVSHVTPAQSSLPSTPDASETKQKACFLSPVAFPSCAIYTQAPQIHAFERALMLYRARKFDAARVAVRARPSRLERSTGMDTQAPFTADRSPQRARMLCFS